MCGIIEPDITRYGRQPKATGTSDTANRQNSMVTTVWASIRTVMTPTEPAPVTGVRISGYALPS